MSQSQVSRLTIVGVLFLYLGLLIPTLADPMVNWRDAVVLSVGRNFCRERAPLWLPRIDARGEQTGITGTEFPILNFVEGLLACRGLPQTPVARVLTLLVSCLGIASLLLLTRDLLGATSTAVATAAFAFSPIVLFYSRTTQPDVPSVALALCSLWVLSRSLATESTRWGWYFLSALLMALAALIKLPAIVFGLPALALLYERRQWSAARKLGYWLYLPIATLPPLIWYWHARDLQERYGAPYIFLGDSPHSLWAAWTRPGFYNRIFVQALFDSYAFPIVSATAVLAYLLYWKKIPRWIRAMAIASVIFFFLAGDSAAHHTSYGMIAVPAIALGAAFGVDRFLAAARYRTALLVSLIACTCYYGWWRTRRWFAAKDAAIPYLQAASDLNRLTGSEEQIAIVSDGDPKGLWFVDRRGWVVDPAETDNWVQLHPQIAVVGVDNNRLALAESEKVARSLRTFGFVERRPRAAFNLWVRPRSN
jgi:MFS family permease